MNTQFRFMDEIFRIVNGALRLDIDKVRNYTLFLADKMETAGEPAAAGRLRRLLNETDHTLKPTNLGSARSLPVDGESRFPIVERVRSGSTEASPVLPDDKWATVHEFISIAKSRAELEAEGIATSLSLLLYGPPGVGKNHLARYIAGQLGMELYLARLDGLVSSYLGSTSKNIRALFEFAARTPCVLFLDEFDAIAKLRGDEYELGELKRVVNSFLQNLDSLGPQAIVIAATNHEELLDRAVWRRFSYRLQLQLPNREQRQKLWGRALDPIGFSSKDIDLLTDLSEGFSGGDITEVILRLQRLRVTSGNAPQLAEAFRALLNLASGDGNELRFTSVFAGLDHSGIAIALRKRNPKLYSHTAIAELLGVSKATAYRMSSSTQATTTTMRARKKARAKRPQTKRTPSKRPSGGKRK